MNPTISVIIPCYKTQEKLLKRCIKSVLAQSFRDFEVIIVDDGNSEEYRTVYNDALFSDSRIIVLKKNNEGVSCARNDGVTKARGEFITFVDADDILLENFFAEAVKIAKDHEADFVIGGNLDCRIIKEKQEEISSQYPIDVLNGTDIKQLRKYMLGERRYWFKSRITKIGHGCWARIIKSSIAKSISFDTKLPIGEDIVWNLEALKKSSVVCIAETVWYGYYYHLESACRRYRANAIQESRDSLLRMKQYLDLNDDGEYYAFCSRAYTDLYRIHQCYLNNNENNLSSAEKRKISLMIYNSDPWAEIKRKRYWAMCSKKEKIYLTMFRAKVLFRYYCLRDMIKKSSGR